MTIRLFLRIRRSASAILNPVANPAAMRETTPIRSDAFLRRLWHPKSFNELRWGRLLLLALALNVALASLAWILVGLVMRT
jgi:hypothetical protein